MDESEKLLMKAMATCICLFFLVTGSCEMHSNHQKAQVIIQTGDPMAWRCAGTGNDAVCGAYVSRDK